MKKFLAVLVAAVTVAVSCSLLPAFATNTLAPPQSTGTMEISAVRTEAISVKIPADASIPWNTQGDYAIGEVSAPQMVIAPDKKVVISLSSLNGFNFKSEDYGLPYLLKGADSIQFTDVNDSSVFPLSVNVAQSDWDSAPAGEYDDILTFTLEYVNK